MKKRKNLLFILMLTIFSTNIVKAECTTEEENNIKKEIDYSTFISSSFKVLRSSSSFIVRLFLLSRLARKRIAI